MSKYLIKNLSDAHSNKQYRTMDECFGIGYKTFDKERGDLHAYNVAGWITAITYWFSLSKSQAITALKMEGFNINTTVEQAYSRIYSERRKTMLAAFKDMGIAPEITSEKREACLKKFKPETQKYIRDKSKHYR